MPQPQASPLQLITTPTAEICLGSQIKPIIMCWNGAKICCQQMILNNQWVFLAEDAKFTAQFVRQDFCLFSRANIIIAWTRRTARTGINCSTMESRARLKSWLFNLARRWSPCREASSSVRRSWLFSIYRASNWNQLMWWFKIFKVIDKF
jgi:hypothetical protein